MYFASRFQAGRMLASKLKEKYSHEQCAVIALNDGGVTVGEQIAKELNCTLNFLVAEEIALPRETVAIGGITSDGNFAYNHQYSEPDLDDMKSEYRGFIEEQKLTKLRRMSRMIGTKGLIDKSLLKGHNVILTSDGFKTSFMLDLAIEYLKTTNIEKLIVAVPISSVQAIDWMHLYVDEIYCLSVIEDYMYTNHYFDQKDIPDKKTIQEIIAKIRTNLKTA